MKKFNAWYLLLFIFTIGCSKDEASNDLNLKSTNDLPDLVNELGILHNEVLDSVSTLSGFPFQYESQFYNAAVNINLFNSQAYNPLQFEDNESLNEIIKSTSYNPSTLYDTILKYTPAGDSSLPASHLVVLNKYCDVFISASEYDDLHGNLPIDVFNTMVDDAINEIIGIESPEINIDDMVYFNYSAACVSSLIIAKDSYQYWVDSEVNTSHPWYGVIPTSKRMGILGAIWKATVDAVRFVANNCWALGPFHGGGYNVNGGCGSLCLDLECAHANSRGASSSAFNY